MALNLFHRKEVTSDKPGRISWGRGRPRSQLLLHFVKCMRCLVANSLLNVRVYSHRWLAPSELAVHGPMHGHFFFAMSDVLQRVRARQIPWTEWQFLWCCWPFSATDEKMRFFLSPPPRFRAHQRRTWKNARAKPKDGILCSWFFCIEISSLREKGRLQHYGKGRQNSERSGNKHNLQSSESCGSL